MCNVITAVVLVDEVNKQKINNSFALMKHNRTLWVGMQMALHCCILGREVQSPVLVFWRFFFPLHLCDAVGAHSVYARMLVCHKKGTKWGGY